MMMWTLVFYYNLHNIVIIFLFSQRLDAVEDLMNNDGVLNDVRGIMRTIPDLDRILRR